MRYAIDLTLVRFWDVWRKCINSGFGGDHKVVVNGMHLTSRDAFWHFLMEVMHDLCTMFDKVMHAMGRL